MWQISLIIALINQIHIRQVTWTWITVNYSSITLTDRFIRFFFGLNVYMYVNSLSLFFFSFFFFFSFRLDRRWLDDENDWTKKHFLFSLLLIRRQRTHDDNCFRSVQIDTHSFALRSNYVINVVLLTTSTDIGINVGYVFNIVGWIDKINLSTRRRTW